MKKIFVLTGEASGDLHGANLIRQLRSLDPSLEIHGTGGPLMHALDLAGFIESAHLNVTGITAALKVLPQYYALYRHVRAHIAQTKPDLIVCIDNPGFNLRLAKRIQSFNIPMIYYICPQVWAWNQGRVHVIKQLFKKCLVIFDFEVDFYTKFGVEAVCVGHPIKDAIQTGSLDPLKDASKDKTVVLMPGSRKNEVKYLLPTLVGAADIIRLRYPGTKFKLLQADTLSDDFYREFLNENTANIELIRKNKYEHLRNADLAILCSGTATLECALFHLPMIVVNKSSALTAFAARTFVKVKYLALPNLLADTPVVPELLQEACTPRNVAEQTIRWFDNPAELKSIRTELAGIDRGLGTPGCSQKAAAEILNHL